MSEHPTPATPAADADLLPLTIATVASIELLAGIGLVIYAFVGRRPELLGPGIGAVLFSPLLYAAADVVRSLRSIASRAAPPTKPPHG